LGGTPENKNREHVLPQWLLSLTGDPKRVVNFGVDYRSGRDIKFDWSSFVVPSCQCCNTEFSNLEARSKEYVVRLLGREALTSLEYIDFMDWLDKVRIGVWIAYHFIQGNPTGIDPNFHIKSRISKKDRMIAIYSLSTSEIGLNTFGAESLVFHSNSTCFGLKINNLLIINYSSDFLFSARCGFPFPKNRETWLDGENSHMMVTNDFDVTRKIKHPLIRKKIIKPSIHLYQPIMIEDLTGQFQSGYIGDFSSYDSYLAKHTLPPYPSGKGILFFQYLNRVEAIYDMDKPIKFESVTGIHSKCVSDLICQIYEFQNISFNFGTARASDIDLLKEQQVRKKMLLKINKHTINYYRNMHKRTHNKQG